MDLVHDSYPSFFNVSSFNFQIFSFPSSRIYSVIINKLKSIKTFYVSNCLKGFFLVWTFDVIDCFKGLGLNVSDCFKGLRGWGRHGRLVVAFTTTCAISAYQSCEFKSHSWRGVVDTTLCNIVCQWLAAGGGFLRVPRFPPPIKWPPCYNWNIVESGIKHHNPNPHGLDFEPFVFLTVSMRLVRWWLKVLS
jgi:hypothetical protein